ncbi:MAG TPA: protein-disulfide reductase DsbD N-terminal domain-containing protein [Edaphobacter sp.]|jgi:hypothetical protein|nr:protein-disulfide reductase DsbD N-terminal domain-containing protein [Edaphobacter sp.]
MRSLLLAGVLLGSGITPALLVAQQESLTLPAARPKQYVAYDSEGQAIEAGKTSTLELRFQVVQGYHVNSHTPKSELLIPTNLTIEPASGVKAAAAEYPAGTTYSLRFDPSEKLDVYTGAFVVKVPVVAALGDHTLKGVLHYQACDNAACYPPKSLPVQIAVTAK